MKNSLPTALLALAVFTVCSSRVLAVDPNGKASENHIFAQTLVNEEIASNHELMIVGLHVILPGAKDETLIACNIDHIGNPDTDLDKAAGIEHMTLLEPKTSAKFEMTFPLKDASDNYIGAIVIVIKRHEGDTELDLYRKGLAVRDGLAKKIPSFTALLEPTK